MFRWRRGDRLRRFAEAVVRCLQVLIVATCDCVMRPLAGRFKCVLFLGGILRFLFAWNQPLLRFRVNRITCISRRKKKTSVVV